MGYFTSTPEAPSTRQRRQWLLRPARRRLRVGLEAVEVGELLVDVAPPPEDAPRARVEEVSAEVGTGPVEDGRVRRHVAVLGARPAELAHESPQAPQRTRGLVDLEADQR